MSRFANILVEPLKARKKALDAASTREEIWQVLRAALTAAIPHSDYNDLARYARTRIARLTNGIPETGADVTLPARKSKKEKHEDSSPEAA